MFSEKYLFNTSLSVCEFMRRHAKKFYDIALFFHNFQEHTLDRPKLLEKY